MPDVEFFGESFTLSDKVGLMPLLRFAHAARQGVDGGSLEGMAAMYDLLAQCFAPEDWERFQDVATRERASEEELTEVVRKAIEFISERPTQRPTESSGGPSSTGATSAADSSSPVIDRLEAQGRPDLALVVKQAQEARAS